VVLVLLVAGGCGLGRHDDLAPNTARFSWGDRSVTVPLADCGREGHSAVMAGATHGTFVQIGADLGKGGAARTGVTGDMGADDGIWGAFGAKLAQGPAGQITRIAVDGDRLTIEGRWARLDGNLVPEPGQPLVDGKVEARCPPAKEQRVS
jgi:hypothetical protein